MVEVRDSLSLDPLRGVNYKDSSFAGTNRSADLIGEIDVAWGVDQVKQVGLAILRVSIYHRSCLCKHCDASLTFHLCHSTVSVSFEKF